MKFQRHLKVAVSTFILMVSIMDVANAAMLTLGSFLPDYSRPNAQFSFVYTNVNPAAIDAVIKVTNAPVTFSFNGGVTNITAVMNMTGSPDILFPTAGGGYGVTDFFGNPEQPIQITSMDIRAKGSMSYPDNTLLLSMTALHDSSTIFSFPAGFLFGSGGGTTGALSGSTSSGSLIHFMSDVVPSVDGSLTNDYSFHLENSNVPMGLDGFAFTQVAEFNSFKANMGGSFAYTPVPEPGILAMFLGMGVGGSLFGFRLRRRV